MSNINKRLEAVEDRVIETCRDNPLPAGERIVVLYPGDDASLERLKSEKMRHLREKYGLSVTESDWCGFASFMTIRLESDRTSLRMIFSSIGMKVCR